MSTARWVMRSSNGSLWATANEYRVGQLYKFLLAKPVAPLTAAQAARIPPGTLTNQDAFKDVFRVPRKRKSTPEAT